MSNAAKHRKKAAEFEQLKQIDRAIASYVRAIEESEADGEDVDVALLNKVGDLALRQGRVPDAVTYYERAVEHYATAGLFNNAIALCNKILRNAPGRSNVYFTLGRICARKGLRGDATRNFLEYAARMQQEGRVEEAMRALGEVADLMPELTEVRRLVDEHAVRAGVELPRRRTPLVVEAVSAPEAPRFAGDKSSNLVFLEVDYSAAAARLTPPIPPRAQRETEAPRPVAEAPARAPLKTPPIVLPFIDLDAPQVVVRSASPALPQIELVGDAPGAPAAVAPTPGAADDVRAIVTETPTQTQPAVDPGVAPIAATAAPTPAHLDSVAFVELPMLDLLGAESAHDDDAQTRIESGGELPMLDLPLIDMPPVDLPSGDLPMLDLAQLDEPSPELSLMDVPMLEWEVEQDGAQAVAPDLVTLDPMQPDTAEIAALDFEPVLLDDVETDAVDLAPTLDAFIANPIDLNDDTPALSRASNGGEAGDSLLDSHADDRDVSPVDPDASAPHPDLLVNPDAATHGADVSSTGLAARESQESATPRALPAVDHLQRHEGPQPESHADSAKPASDGRPTPTYVTPTVVAAVSATQGSATPMSGAAMNATPVSITSAIATPASATPASAMPASVTPASMTPASVTSVSMTPASLRPVSLTPASLTPASITPASSAPSGATPASTTPFTAVPALRARTPLSASPIPAIEAAIAAGAEVEARAAAERPATRRPPFRLDPHDFILPGELPPLLVDDALVEAGLRRARAAVTSLPTPIASVAFVTPTGTPRIVPRIDTPRATESVPVADDRAPEPNPLRDHADGIPLDVASAFSGDTLVSDAAESAATPSATSGGDPDDHVASQSISSAPDGFADEALHALGVEESARSDSAALTGLDTDADEELDRAIGAAVRMTPSLPIAAVAAEANAVAESRRDELRAAVADRPQDWALRRRLAEALFEAGQRDAALAELEASLQGFVHAGQIADAADVSEMLVGVSPERVSYHQKRVELAVRLNDQQRLRFAYLDLADALVRSGEEARAQAVYVRVLEIDPLDDRARAALGNAAPPPPPPKPTADEAGFVNLSDWLRDDDAPVSTRMRMREPVVSGDEQADFAALLRHFKDGVSRSLGDEDFESRYDLGVAFKEMGLLDDAIGEFQKALRSKTHRLPAYEALGQCFVEQGRYQVAATVLSRALHEPGLNDEQRVGVLYLLAYSCEALQRWGEARSYFQRVYATDINFRDVAARLAALEQVAS